MIIFQLVRCDNGFNDQIRLEDHSPDSPEEVNQI